MERKDEPQIPSEQSVIPADHFKDSPLKWLSIVMGFWGVGMAIGSIANADLDPQVVLRNSTIAAVLLNGSGFVYLQHRLRRWALRN